LNASAKAVVSIGNDAIMSDMYLVKSGVAALAIGFLLIAPSWSIAAYAINMHAAVQHFKPLSALQHNCHAEIFPLGKSVA
jgi:membrane protein implicated in regulation of membrane protease activity